MYCYMKGKENTRIIVLYEKVQSTVKYLYEII